MKVILIDAHKKYRDRPSTDRQELEKFIQTHRLYKPHMNLSTLVRSVQESLKKNRHSGFRGQQPHQQQQTQESLQQLSLYLNKDNNKQIFSLFEHILAHPKGVTYDALSKKVKSDIITVSHYCCKLKKLRLIDWQHQKQGVVVFPRSRKQKQDGSISYHQFPSQVSYDIKQSFLFKELNLNQNIWINISSEESITRGGLTNEEIKRKIMKHAENKMVRRTVESMKFLDRNAERQGKVFEFKYKNQTPQIKMEMANKKQEQPQMEEEIDILQPSILEWLEEQFPEFSGQNFLLKLINNKFKDYLSILGVKQSKRQCTPLKLNRYIKVLNYLHREGGMKESELRALIVKDEVEFNVGIMHKRSLMGILEGLKSLEIIAEVDGIYQPGWIDQQKWTKKEEPPKRMKQEQYDGLPKKKIHLDGVQVKKVEKVKKIKVNGVAKESQNMHFHKISEKQYRLQLFIAILTLDLEKALTRCFRKAFNRIVYVERKKNVAKYSPQLHVLGLLQDQDKPELSLGQNVQQFYKDLDMLVQQKGEKEPSFDQVQNELVKFIRKNPSRSSNFLRIKYGKNWSSKFEQLQNAGAIKADDFSLRLSDTSRFLI